MNRPQNLRHSVINQVINGTTRGSIPSSLPSQSALAEIYSINCTMVRHILCHLCERGALSQVNYDYQILRQPEVQDGFNGSGTPLIGQSRLFEQASFTMINRCQLRTGERFSELQLARVAGVSPVVARELLLKPSCYNPIESEKCGQWNMKGFEQSQVEQLSELREMLEAHAFQHFFDLPGNDARWLQIKTLFERHRTLWDSVGNNFYILSQPDHDFHSLPLSATDNIFSNQSLEITSVIFHLRYQWDESDLK